MDRSKWSLQIGQVNTVLIGIYFVPVWGLAGFKTLTSYVHGLDDRAQFLIATFYHRLLDLEPASLVRVAAAFGGLKLIAASAFLACMIGFVRTLVTTRNPDDETTDLCLILALATVLLSAIPALASGDGELIRLCATQFLLIVGAGIIVGVERSMLGAASDPASVLAPRRSFFARVRTGRRRIEL